MRSGTIGGLAAWWLASSVLLGSAGPAFAAEKAESLGPEMLLQTGHFQRVASLAVSPDGKYLLTGSNDFSAVLWEIATGRQLRRFTGHVARLAAVGFSPDGNRVLTAADYSTIGVREWFSYAQDKVPLLTKICFGQEQLVGFSGQGSNFPVLPTKTK